MNYSDLDLTSPTVIKKILSDQNFVFSKSLGQNYLIDRNIVNKIISAAVSYGEDKKSEHEKQKSKELVIEIGTGFGVLTKELCKQFSNVVAIEKDKTIPEILLKTVPAHNLKLIVDDALKIDLSSIIQKEGFTEAILVANLPYYIATTIIMMVLERIPEIKSLIVMVQKEVAERILSSPGNKNYGALTVGVNYFASSSIVTSVSKGCFMPSPKVDSAVIKLDRRPQLFAANKTEEEFFFRVVRAIFSKRRKTLLNSLSSGNIGTKPVIKNVIISLGYSADIRGETLNVNEIFELSKRIWNWREDEKT